jgi:hypothetical protein
MSGEPASAVVAAAEPDRSFSLAAERLLLGRMLASLGSPPIQLVLWDGQQVGKTHEENPARLLVRDRSAFAAPDRRPGVPLR